MNEIVAYKLKKSLAAVKFHEKAEAKEDPEEFKTLHETGWSKGKVRGRSLKQKDTEAVLGAIPNQV